MTTTLTETGKCWMYVTISHSKLQSYRVVAHTTALC